MSKKIPVILCMVFFSLVLGGCQFVRIEEGQVIPVEYTLVKREDIPGEAMALIEEKKEKEFQVTYQNGQELYLIKGYGRQMSGGYSICVEELGTVGETLRFKTKLIGPSDDKQKGEPSYPYIVVKIKYRDEHVEFR